jgi:DNA polymerase-3 subunit delta'
LKLAQALLCDTNPEEELRPCEKCESCVMVAASTHPDVEVISKPADKSFIPVELFIGDREHRMREGLCHNISLKPFRGGRKIAIIDDADYLNQEGANSLLKTLEEPPPKSMLILIGTSEQKQLPTIRSRCQLVRFRPLSTEHVAQLLLSHGLVTDATEAERLAQRSNGSLERALELADPALDEFRKRLFSELSRGVFHSVPFAKEVSEFVDGAGKEAPPRRARLRQVIGYAADFYRNLIRHWNGMDDDSDESLVITAANSRLGRQRDDEVAATCVERCLDALAQVDANANQATLIECWLDDLVEIVQSRRLPA